jgi:hypothetical protein
MLSPIDTVLELTVVVVPLTIKSPLRVKPAAFTVPVNVGLAENTNVPVPVSSVTAVIRFALLGVSRNVAIPAPNDVMPVPPLATGSVPVMPVVRGNPVQLVRVPEPGVPRAGVVNVGLVNVLLVRVCVPVSVTSVSVPEGTVNVEVPDVVNVKVCAADIVRVAPETPTLVML